MKLPRCAAMVVAFGIASRCLSAQALPSGTMGIIGGVNLAKFKIDQASSSGDHRTGYMFGATFVSPRSSYLSIQADLLYSMKGSSYTSPTGTFTNKLDYFELPLLLRVAPATNAVSTFRPFVQAGPSFAFKLRCGGENENAGVKTKYSCAQLQELTRLNVKSLDPGVALGAGLDMDLGPVVITVGARYTAGLVSIYDNGGTKNRVVGIYAAFSRPFVRYKL